jgi:quaternary ammonium compound-resistance protein SugE
LTSGQANFYFIVELLQHKSTVIMNCIALIIAGILEIGWPLGLKMSQQQVNNKTLWILLAVLSMAISGGLLWYSQKSIPIGTAYAVWTGIGAVGTLVVGIFFFGDSASIFRLLAALLIVIGIVGLKFAN